MDDKKIIDLRHPVQKLCAQYPELADIMRDLGVTEIVKPGMLATVGRVMTIPKGAVMRGVDMETVKRALTENGFEVINEEEQP